MGIMIVSAIIALLAAAIAVPGFLRARKRSQASQIVNDLRLIGAAVDQYAVENNRWERLDHRDRAVDCLPEARHHSL